MSHEEDLIDYSDEELQTTDAAATTAAPAANGAQDKKGDLTVSGGRRIRREVMSVFTRPVFATSCLRESFYVPSPIAVSNIHRRVS